MGMNFYVWTKPWGGRFGSAVVAAAAKTVEDAELLAVQSLREAYTGYKLGRIRKIGKPDMVCPVGDASTVLFDLEADVTLGNSKGTGSIKIRSAS